MSYLSRIASRVSGLSQGAPTASAFGRPAPAMRIDSPIVAADQRLGLPEFPSLMSLDSSAAATAASGFGDPFAEPLQAHDAGRGAEPRSKTSAPHGTPLHSAGVARSHWPSEGDPWPSAARRGSEARTPALQAGVLPAARESPVHAASAARPSAAESRAVFAPSRLAETESPRAASATLDPLQPSPAGSAPARPLSAFEADASSVQRALRMPEPRAASAATGGLAVAMAELNSWLNGGAASAAGGAPDHSPSRPGFAHRVGEEPPAPKVSSARLQPRAEPASLSPAPNLPSPALGPAEAAGPVIRIGRIEVEVVPPPSPVPVRATSAASPRTSRGARSTGFDAPQRAFGWRQR
jgi:hypothetical protein